MLIKLLSVMLTVLATQTVDGRRSVGGGPEPATESNPANERLTEGIWPSQKLVRLLVLRWCDEIGDKYELSEEQRHRYGKAEAKRWTEFMTRNRAEVQPVINEFIEMRMELEPPAKQRVQEWAQRATPVFAELRGKINQATQEFRDVLTPLQEAKFESDVLEMGMKMQFASTKLKQWRGGEFKEEEFWEPTRAEHRRRDEKRRKEREAETGETAEGPPAAPKLDQISQEVIAWEKYVERFIDLYALDEGQRDAARSCLAELKARALAHRDRRREDIARLEYRIEQHTGFDQQLAEIKKQLVELYGPIDEMFKELKRRTEQIPTANQKAKFGQPDGKDK